MAGPESDAPLHDTILLSAPATWIALHTGERKKIIKRTQSTCILCQLHRADTYVLEDGYFMGYCAIKEQWATYVKRMP